jgi:hypothetical protein
MPVLQAAPPPAEPAAEPTPARDRPPRPQGAAPMSGRSPLDVAQPASRRRGHGLTIVDAAAAVPSTPRVARSSSMSATAGARLDVIAEQARASRTRTGARSHEPPERTADVAPHLPMVDPAIYRSQVLRGVGPRLLARTSRARRADRLVVSGPLGAYHGNTLGASTSGTAAAACRPYGPGSAGSGTSARRTRTAATIRGRRPLADAGAGRRADQAFTMAGLGSVAAFVAEPTSGLRSPRSSRRPATGPRSRASAAGTARR